MNKKFFYVIVSIFIFLNFKNCIFGYSEKFNILLETMDIEKNNIHGLNINEEIYNEYKLLVYGSPLDGFKKQRWKNVKNGHWTKNSNSWKGTGERGEYWILGENYNGKEVHNHLFPVDIEPPTPPTKWKYANIKDALESWQDVEKYIDINQKEYMITQNLMRNGNIYEIKIPDIGFEKVRLENYATWKTQGSVYTERYDRSNKRWAANFMIPPMAGNAEIKSFGIFENGTDYLIKENNKNLNIPIIYGAKVLNLTNYAKPEHVKYIISEIYINDKLIDKNVGNEKLYIEKNINYLVESNNMTKDDTLKLNVKIKSMLVTKFTTDGPLIDVKNYVLTVSFNEKNENKYISNENYIKYPDIPPPKITGVEVKKIKGGEETDLYYSTKTQKPFICAGETILFRVKATNVPERVKIKFSGNTSITKFDNLTKRFEWYEPRERGEKTFLRNIEDFENMYDGVIGMQIKKEFMDETIFECNYIIPYGTVQTIHSWNSLREQNKDAFNIPEYKLFNRINKPYEIVFTVSGPTGSSSKRIELDVFERWDTLYNRDISKYIMKRENI